MNYLLSVKMGKLSFALYIDNYVLCSLGICKRYNQSYGKSFLENIQNERHRRCVGARWPSMGDILRWLFLRQCL